MPIIVSQSGASGGGGSTKTVADLITRAQNEFKGITLTTTDALDFANEIYQIIGLATPWDFLLKDMTFDTVANQQDYLSVPSDFLRLKGAWLNDDSSTFTPMIPLAMREQLDKTNTRGRPIAISVENLNFRLWPQPNQTRPGAGGMWRIFLTYYKKPGRISSTGDLFEFSDLDVESVMMAGFIARVAQFLDEDRAGQWEGRNAVGQFVGTGLWGKFAAALNNMVRHEELASGVEIWAPESELRLY